MFHRSFWCGIAVIECMQHAGNRSHIDQRNQLVKIQYNISLSEPNINTMRMKGQLYSKMGTCVIVVYKQN